MGSAGRRWIPIVVVDTFADRPFHGSPCPVCVLPNEVELDDRTMEDISKELNMAEMAFVRPLGAHDDLTTVNRVGLRWFIPGGEVKLCGHGTFATAAVLFDQLGNRSSQVTCVTRFSGDLVLKHDGDVIRVDFPLGLTVRKTQAEYATFIKSLGRVHNIQEVALCPSLRYLLVSLSPGWTRQQFEDWRCDMAVMEQAVANSDVIVVIVTVPGDGSKGQTGNAYDFLSRVFVPFSVRPEDYVTGSAHTVLAHYWSQRLGKKDLYARQCSARPGEVVMEVEGDRVHMMAHATIVMQGMLHV